MDATDGLLRCSDEDLLARFRRGRRDAFACLVRRYENELYGYLRRYLGDGTLAAEDSKRCLCLACLARARRAEKNKAWTIAELIQR